MQQNLDDVFLVSAAHDLKTPLAVISAVLKDSEDLNQAQDRQLMLAQTRQAISLIDDLLRVYKIQQNRDALSLGPVVFSAVLNDCLHNHRIGRRNLKLKADKGFKKAITVADNYLLSRMISNILDNSLKHANASDIVIKTTITADELCCTIADKGAPLSEHDQKFLRGEVGYQSTRRLSGSSGLGLYLMSQMAHLMNLQLSVSNDGEYNRFSLKLPVVKQLSLFDSV